MSSPITTWEGAEAYFTFAQSPSAIAIILALSVIAVFFVLYNMVMHENESYRKLE